MNKKEVDNPNYPRHFFYTPSPPLLQVGVAAGSLPLTAAATVVFVPFVAPQPLS